MASEKRDVEGMAPAVPRESVEHMSVGRYVATRIPTLKPPMHKAPNPFKLLALLNFQQWMFFLVAFSLDLGCF